MRGRSSDLEHTRWGELGLAILPTPALPIPSFPALCCEDTTPKVEVGRPMIPQSVIAIIVAVVIHNVVAIIHCVQTGGGYVQTLE